MTKNTMYQKKDELSDKTKARLRSEVARLEARNTKTLQELREAEQEVTRLKARKSELEAVHRQQADRISEGDSHFDEIMNGLKNLTFRSQERKRRYEEGRAQQRRVPDTLSSKSPAVKSEQEEQEDSEMSSTARPSRQSNPRTINHSTPASSGQLEIRQRRSTATSLQPSSPPCKPSSSDKRPQKRAFSSDIKPEHTHNEKRRKEDYAQAAQHYPQQRASDPRLQAGRRQRP